MGFADAGGAEQQHILPMGHIATGGQIQEAPFVEGGLEREVKPVERLDHGKLREGHPQLQELVVFALEFLGQNGL